MADVPAVKVDPFEDSRRHLLAITFPRSTSPTYPLAVSVANGAVKHETVTIGRTLTHFVVFDRTPDGVARALALLGYVATWRGVQVYAGGKMIPRAWTINEVLHCYAVGCACNDWRAHCLEVIDEPLSERSFGGSFTITVSLERIANQPPKSVARYTFPCRYLRRYFRFEHGHPATVPDQIQAAAVAHGCDWCPHFNPGNFVKLS